MDAISHVFEEHRRVLEGLAYRMLGTLADAQDVVQDTYLKWRAAEHSDVRDARAWLITVCSRLALNTLRSARHRRESYVGVWLPEPMVADQAMSPAEQFQIDETISMALLLALEKLSPGERAAFLLHEVFGYSFAEVGQVLDKTETSCRKLASRAKVALAGERPRFEVRASEHQRLLEAFFAAARAGEFARLKSLFAETVEFYSDGGGKAHAVPEVMCGAEPVAAFFSKILLRDDIANEITVRAQWYNGTPGILIYERGVLVTAICVDVFGGAITKIFALRNPDKLKFFGRGTGVN